MHAFGILFCSPWMPLSPSRNVGTGGHQTTLMGVPVVERGLERGTFGTRARGSADARPAPPVVNDGSWQNARHFRIRSDVAPSDGFGPFGVTPAACVNMERAAQGRLEMLQSSAGNTQQSPRALPEWWAGGAPRHRPTCIADHTGIDDGGNAATTSTPPFPLPPMPEQQEQQRRAAAEHYARSPRGLVQQFAPDEAAWPLRPSPPPESASAAPSQLPSASHPEAGGGRSGIPWSELTELSLLRAQPGAVHRSQQRDVPASLSELATLEARLADKMAALGRLQSVNHSPRRRTGPTPAWAVGASPRAGRRRISQEAERLLAAGKVMRSYEDPTMHWEWQR